MPLAPCRSPHAARSVPLAPPYRQADRWGSGSARASRARPLSVVTAAPTSGTDGGRRRSSAPRDRFLIGTFPSFTSSPIRLIAVRKISPNPAMTQRYSLMLRLRRPSHRTFGGRPTSLPDSVWTALGGLRKPSRPSANPTFGLKKGNFRTCPVVCLLAAGWLSQEPCRQLEEPGRIRRANRALNAELA